MPAAIHHFDSESQPLTPNWSLIGFRIETLKSTGDSESKGDSQSEKVARATTSEPEKQANFRTYPDIFLFFDVKRAWKLPET